MVLAIRAGMAAVFLLALLGAGVAAQSGAGDFNQALLREDVLRSNLGRSAGEAPGQVLQQVRDLVAEYERIAGRARGTEGASALYHGALLAADAFWQFGGDDDRQTALRLFTLLRQRYPASPLLARVTVHARRLTGSQARTESGPAETPTGPPPAATEPPPAAPAPNTSGGFSLSRQLGLGISRVVIDPGHGGHDAGAEARGLREAELTLDVALRLEALLRRQPGVEVLLTRRTDEFIPLEERTAIANRAGADVFLSIHANANPNPQVRGIETYFLNFAANPEAEAVAARENAGSARTMSSLPDIVKAIALNNKVDESRAFAGLVQTAMVDRLRRVHRSVRNLGVKQAPFVVLIGASMPSVLAEISFVTNRQEATLLATADYRQAIAEALLSGISTYQKSLKSAPTAGPR